jgi:predicted  nucleic acid-binding Zn-ribbon protein
MDSLNFQEVIPLSIWAFSSAVGMMIILIAMFLYLYYRKRLQAVVGDGSNEADLASKVAQLQKDEDVLRDWMARQKDELQSLASERQDQILVQAELQRIEQECAKNEEFNRSLRNEVGSLENKKHLLTEKSQKLEQEIGESEKNIEQLQSQKEELSKSVGQSTLRILELERECARLASLQEQKHSELRELERTSREIKNEVEFLRLDHSALKSKIDTLRERGQEVDLIREKILVFQLELDDIRNKVAIQQRLEDEAARKVKKYDEEIKDLNDRKAFVERDLEDLGGVMQRLNGEFENIDRQVNEIRNTLQKRKSEISEVEQELATKKIERTQTDVQVNQNRDDLEKLKTEETSLKASISTLKVLAKKYNKSLGFEDGGSGSKYRDLWQPVTFPALNPANTPLNEQEMLRKTSDYIKAKKLHFPERVLHAFHTALKVNEISPLVVLAGISGTGKSELPRRYAEGMGMHSVILAVQPRWDSPQDLFGFYNYLEERYKATELARAMVQFEQYNREHWPLPEGWDNDRSDRMLLVLLDEMNLARVEYYFSEFLSRLEIRRGIDLNNFEERAKAEIALEMGSLTEGEKPIRLFPGQNVLFSGTMNEDETTQALSDKVLDRSCVLRFGRPKQITEDKDLPVIPPTPTGLTFKQWKTFLKNDLPSEDKDRVNGWINNLNNAMDKLDRPFGHRVIHAIQRYIANYPSWVPNRVNLAMADQIEQRIMPKLRGIELDEADQPLEEIQSVIEACDDGPLLKAFKQGAKSQKQVFIWKGFDKTEQPS